MREYNITKSDLGYHICRVKEENGIEMKEWLQNNAWSKNAEFAKTFYHLSDATSAFILARIRGKKETPTISTRKSESEGCREKKSWSEL